MFFSDVGGKAERGTPYYIHTRVRQASAGVYIREMKRKYQIHEIVCYIKHRIDTVEGSSGS